MTLLSPSMFNVGRSMFNVPVCLMILASGFSSAQTLPDQDLRLELLPSGEKLLHWTGHPELTYFLQASPDLQNWTWAPNIEPGITGPMSYEVDGPSTAGFYRLQYTDQAPGPGETVGSADYDGDGLTNLQEITPRPRPGGVPIGVNISPNIQTNPLRKDTDGDGLDDQWEEDHGLDPTDNGSRDSNNGANGDPDQDGATNLQEQTAGIDPQNPDSDADGFLDGSEVEQGKSPTDPNDAPVAEWFVLLGNKPMGQVKSETRKYTIRKGQTRIIVVGTESKEYPLYTKDDGSIFDDVLEWHITPSSGSSINGYIHVNDRDLDWIVAEANGTTLNGSSPAHIERFKVIQAPENSDITITVQLKATNISDGGYPSQVIVGLLPLEVRGFLMADVDETIGVIAGPTPTPVTEKRRDFVRNPDQTIKTKALDELKIAQWDEVLEGDHDTWEFSDTNFKVDRDAFRIRLANGYPFSGNGKQQFTVWTTKANGTIMDAGAVVELNPYSEYLESDVLSLVADEVDDAHPACGVADGVLNDHTYLTELGGKVHFKWLTAPGGLPHPEFSMPVPIKKVVTAQGYIFNPGYLGSSQPIPVSLAKSYFNRARLILATCGVKLEYDASNIVPNPPGVDFGSLFPPSKFQDPRFVTDHVELDPEPKSVITHCRPPEGTIPVYFVGYFERDFAGVTTVQSAMLTPDLTFANAVFIDTTRVKESTVVHELMHVLLNAAHDGPNTLWHDAHSERPWKIWYSRLNFGVQETGVKARRRVMDSMRHRILNSPFSKSPTP